MALFGKSKKEEKKKEEKKVSSSSDTKKTSMKDLYGGTAKPKKSKVVQSAKSKEKGDSKSEGDVKKESSYNFAYKHLIRPLITEKAAHLATEGKYVFEVSGESNKIEVAKSIEEIYGLRPTKVNIINMKGKRKMQGRISGKRKDWKKAIVSLKKGDSIDIYEGV